MAMKALAAMSCNVSNLMLAPIMPQEIFNITERSMRKE